MRCIALTLGLVVASACDGGPVIEDTVDAAVDPDPLAITNTAPAGSLDDLHEKIIARRCSGQPGLCHNGQFEPNLSTPGLTYTYLVNRPGIEKGDRLRVRPGNPSASLFIDKIRNRNGVATQMPLGAEPLEEADVQALEKWITDGALRAPGAAPAPVLNNAPKRPQFAVYDAGGASLDSGGVVNLNQGQTVTFRHTVQDFETADSAIPFAGMILQAGNNNAALLNPGAPNNDPHVGPTTFDTTNPPMGVGDALNWERAWTVPTGTIPIWNDLTKVESTIPASNANFQLQVFYIDQIDTTVNPPKFGMISFDFATFQIHIN